VQANASQHTSGGAGGAQPDGILVATLGAVAAGILVVAAGAIAQAPLRRVPENALKYTVGIMLTTFGTFWGGEGLGIHWWQEDLFLPLLAALYFLYTRALVLGLRTFAPKASATTLPKLDPSTSAERKEALR
jgi:uncharacterized membrane protein